MAGVRFGELIARLRAYPSPCPSPNGRGDAIELSLRIIQASLLPLGEGQDEG